MDSELAEKVLKGLKAMDPPIGRLMEVAKGMVEDDQKRVLVGISGELLQRQFELIDLIVDRFPELDDWKAP